MQLIRLLSIISWGRGRKEKGEGSPINRFSKGALFSGNIVCVCLCLTNVKNVVQYMHTRAALISFSLSLSLSLLLLLSGAFRVELHHVQVELAVREEGKNATT